LTPPPIQKDKHECNRTKKIDMNKDEVREWWVDKESENLMDRRTGTNSEH